MTTKAPPRERGLIMTAESVRAIFDGRKSQTRRVANLSKRPGVKYEGYDPRGDEYLRCPFGQRGDRLWVRETWAAVDDVDPSQGALYRAHPMYDLCEPSDFAWPWKSPMIMPRWASRLTLELTAVRVERLQSISEADAKAEGAAPEFEVDLSTFTGGSAKRLAALSTYRLGYKHAWDRINEARGYPWSANPWVWVLEFRRVT
jgi:hypothetical protein